MPTHNDRRHGLQPHAIFAFYKGHALTGNRPCLRNQPDLDPVGGYLWLGDFGRAGILLFVAGGFGAVRSGVEAGDFFQDPEGAGGGGEFFDYGGELAAEFFMQARGDNL